MLENRERLEEKEREEGIDQDEDRGDGVCLRHSRMDGTEGGGIRWL